MPTEVIHPKRRPKADEEAFYVVLCKTCREYPEIPMLPCQGWTSYSRQLNYGRSFLHEAREVETLHYRRFGSSHELIIIGEIQKRPSYWGKYPPLTSGSS